jgi:N-methylhydantoinase B
VVERFAGYSRDPTERKGDLKAQAAANITGGRRISKLIERYGERNFGEAARYSFSHSEALARKRIGSLKKGRYRADDVLEGPNQEELHIRVRVDVSSSGLRVDYAGTSKQVDYPLNAVFGVTISGVYFVLRSLVGDDVPANQGAFRLVKVDAPTGSLVNPNYPAPVGGGNVETSQRNADVLFLALSGSAPGRVPAAAGGSMNNVMMGADRWAFYETIGVGLGGSARRDGIDGIQANMTNTMNTPIEDLERRFPIRIVRYELRPDSGGPGTHRGGTGIVRSYMSLSNAVSFTIIADRETHPPWGLRGGLPGACTEVLLTGRSGTRKVSSKSTQTLGSGDTVEIRTAGGGGHGDPERRRRSLVRSDLEAELVSESTSTSRSSYSEDK